jgi:hypothetical protein
LITALGSWNRAVFFTSGRVVQYIVTPFNASQLLHDYPYLSGGRLDMAGRNYGLVQIDPNNPQHVILVSGAPSQNLLSHVKAGAMPPCNAEGDGCDWANIERHVSVYNMRNNTLQDRFYSYAHDHSNSHIWEGRVVYPANAMIKTGTGRSSRIGYNVYSLGHWYFHISEPGGTQDRYALRDLFVWDIRDIDGDGGDEIIASPTRWASDPDVPGYYFPKFFTTMYRWNESTLSLPAIKSFPGLIPELAPRFREKMISSSEGYLYPVQILEEAGVTKMMMYNGVVPLLVNY